MSFRFVSKRITSGIAAFGVATVTFMGTSLPVNAYINNVNQILNNYMNDEEAQDEQPEDEVIADPTLLDNVFGEVVYYRWDRVYHDSYPYDTNWHLSMLVWTRDKGNIDDGYIGAVAPDDIWLGPEAKPVEGVTNRFSKSDPVYKKYFKEEDFLSEGSTYYIRMTDRAEGIDIGSDPQVKPKMDTFYTDDDRDCIYVKYGKRDSDNKGLDGSGAPVYMIKMSTRPDVNRDYILEPGGNEEESWLKIHGDEYGYEWSFQSKNYKNAGEIWYVFYNKDNEDDPNLGIEHGLRFLTARSDDDDYAYYKWFIGTKLRYSAITQNVTVGSGQVLSISASNYVSTEGKAESQHGVILTGGNTITVEKGGILSVSGDFINNGTIVNNGGTILVQKGGNIYPFLQGDNSATLGCGTIKCNSGEIIIEEGGAIYAGMNCALSEDKVKRQADFRLDNSATVVNYGLLCVGQVTMGKSAVIENRANGMIYSCLYDKNWNSFIHQLKDNNSKLLQGNVTDLRCLNYVKNDSDTSKYMGGIKPSNVSGLAQNPGMTPSLYYTSKDKVKNKDVDWDVIVKKGLINFKELEL